MKSPALRCSNCDSRRRGVHRAGFCAKCYYWHRKASKMKNKHNGPRPSRLNWPSGAERVLQEYAWRERNLNASDVDPLAIETLIYGVAAKCRSEIGFPIHSLLNSQSAESRRCMYQLFLAILENTPCSAPRRRIPFRGPVVRCPLSVLCCPCSIG